MLNAKHSSNPYDTTRPKAFFGDRKRMYVEEVTTGSGGRSYNPSWNAHRKPVSQKISDRKSDNHSAIMFIAPISIYFGVIIISILTVL